MTQATLYSATNLEPKVITALESKFGCKLESKLDKTLIAGVRLVSGSSVTEISLQDLLQKLLKSI
jgi:F0F1-type ATP synthase delta subunit